MLKNYLSISHVHICRMRIRARRVLVKFMRFVFPDIIALWVYKCRLMFFFLTFCHEFNNEVYSTYKYFKWLELMICYFNYLQEEYVQKTDMTSAPSSFKDEQKKEVQIFLQFLFYFFSSIISCVHMMVYERQGLRTYDLIVCFFRPPILDL